MSKKKTRKKQHKQLIKGGVVASLAIAGAFTVKELNSSGDFQPFESLRKFNYNQVVFEDSSTGKKGQDNASSSDSELWMQDKNSQTQLNPAEIPKSQYLFAQNKENVSETNTTPVVSATDPGNEDIIPSDTPRDENGAIVITPNAPNSDNNSMITLPDSNGGTNPDSPMPGGDNPNGGIAIPGGTDTPSDPNAPGGDTPGGNTPSTRPTLNVPEAPNMGRVDPSKKPTVEDDFLAKPETGRDMWESIRDDYSPSTSLPQTDPKTGQKITYSIVVSNQNYSSDDGSSYIKTILCTGDSFSVEKILETIRMYVVGMDEDKNIVRVLDVSQLGDNLRVDAVPSKLNGEDFQLKFYFRPSADDEWNVSEPYRVQVSDYRLVLENPNDGAADKTIVFDEGDSVDLSAYYADMIPAKYKQNYNPDTKEYDLDALFTGWNTLDGQPANSFDGTGYNKGEIKLSTDGLITDLAEKGYAAKWTKYGQTLTKMPYHEFADGTYTVPNYIDAIDLELKSNSDDEDDDDPLGITWINELKVSDSLKYMDLSYASINSFSIDGESSRYEIKDGILYGKSNGVINEVLGIPFDTNTLYVPKDVTRISLPLINFVETIMFEGETPPDMTVNWLATGNDINLIVPQGSELAYFKKWYKDLNPDVYICSKMIDEQTGKETIVQADFVVENGMILSSDRTILYGVESSVTGILFVPDTIEVIKTGAFEDANVKSVFLPHGNVILEQDSLSGSLTNVLIDSEEIPDNIENAIGSNSSVEVKGQGEFRCGVTKSGYRWLVSDGITTLLSVPEDLREFNCSFVDDDGNVIIPDAIGPNAFSDAIFMETAILDKKTQIIGLDAFSGCASLRIFLSYADTIMVQSGVFDRCNKLVYAVFNARSVIEFDAECKTGVGFCPFYSYGYPRNFYAGGLDIRPDVSYFWDNGLLYGVSYGPDGKDKQTTTLMYASSQVSGTITLRDDTKDVTIDAFANCKGITSIKGLEHISWFGDRVFMSTNLGGNIALDDAWIIRESAFAGCKNITAIDFSNNQSLYSIGYTAFAGTGISDIVLPSTLKECSADVFFECENAVTVHIQSGTPFSLSRWSATTPFSFGNVDKLILEGDAAGKEQDYINAWKYSFLALGAISDDQTLYKELYWDYYSYFRDSSTGKVDEEGLDAYVLKEIKRISVGGENKIRTLFGMELLEEPEKEPLPEKKADSSATREPTDNPTPSDGQMPSKLPEVSEVTVDEQTTQESAPLVNDAGETVEEEQMEGSETESNTETETVQEQPTDEQEQPIEERTPASESTVQEETSHTAEQTEQTERPDTGAEQMQNEVIEE